MLNVQSTRLASFVYGRVSARVASLELRYRDGDVTTVRPVEGYVLAAVPARHARDGHRVTTIVGRDEHGKEVGRQRFRPG